jgi:SsrA-binding protein
MTEKTQNVKQIADNRSARHEYFILERHEAGIELYGTEVKSIRAGNVNLKEAWVEIKDGEAFVVSMHVSPYEKGNIFNRDPLRRRRLLLHKREIRKLYAEVKQGGLTLIPLSLYLKGSRVKVQVGLCKGKKLYDKRDSIAKRDSERRARREIGKNLG